MRFSVLTSDRLEDAEFAEAEQREFIYNRDDPAHRLVSQGLRDQSALDSLGLQKAKWLEEVHKKFNVLSLINFVFRECLDTEFAPSQQSDGVADVERPQSGPASMPSSPSPHPSNNKAGSKALGASSAVSGVTSGQVPLPGPLSLLHPDQLAVLRQQYLRKEQDGSFDALLVDSLLKSSAVPLEFLNKLKAPIRHKLLRLGTFGSLASDTYDLAFPGKAAQGVARSSLPWSSEEIILVVSGTMDIQILKGLPNKAQKQASPAHGGSAQSKGSQQASSYQWQTR